jgi:hypothetical protein
MLEIGRSRHSATGCVGSRDIAIAMIDATCQKQIRPTGTPPFEHVGKARLRRLSQHGAGMPGR